MASTQAKAVAMCLEKREPSLQILSKLKLGTQQSGGKGAGVSDKV